MNKAMIIGNLTRDPEMRTTASGISVCRFTVAVTKPFNRDETDFITVVAWRKTAEIIGKYVTKGNKIAISGYIQTGSYDDKDGNRRYTTEIIAEDFEFLTPKGAGGQKDNDAPPPPKESGLFEEEKSDFEPLDDEQMPF
jgi:single-strand DNA-binding protein